MGTVFFGSDQWLHLIEYSIGLLHEVVSLCMSYDFPVIDVPCATR